MVGAGSNPNKIIFDKATVRSFQTVQKGSNPNKLMFDLTKLNINILLLLLTLSFNVYNYKIIQNRNNIIYSSRSTVRNFLNNSDSKLGLNIQTNKITEPIATITPPVVSIIPVLETKIENKEKKVVAPVKLVKSIPIKPVPIVQPVSNGIPASVISNYARSKVANEDWACLQKLWGSESGWEAGRLNPSSLAVGIPQALPPSKIYPDFPNMERTTRNGKLYLVNPDYKREIDWGLNYIKSRYKSPCLAYNFWLSKAPINGKIYGHWY